MDAMTEPKQLSLNVNSPSRQSGRKAGRNKRLLPVCVLRCRAEPVRVFSVDGITYLLANDVMRAAGNNTASSSVEHAVSTFPELQVEGTAILRPVEGMNGKANRLLTVEGATALVARSRSRFAVDVQRWLYSTFGGATENSTVPPDQGPDGAAPMVPVTELVRMELTVTIDKARRILAIAAK